MDVFTPNELIRAVWAQPPRPLQNRRVRRGVWHIMTGLLRDGGILNSPDAPRSWRWPALLLAGLYQLLWCFVLLWLMYFRFLIIPWAPPEDGANAGRAIEVSFIDDTRPPEPPALPTPLPEPIPAPLPPPRPEVPAQPAPEPVPPIPEPEPEPLPVPEPPTPPLVVTEVDTPDEDAFTLHVPEFQRPQAPLSPDLPVTAQRELVITEVPLLQRPDTIPPPRTPPVSALATDIHAPELTLPERDIPAPLPELELRALPTRSAAVASVDIPARTLDISEREIPSPLPEIDLRAPQPSELPSLTFSPHIREITEREIALPAAPEHPAADAIVEIDLTPPSGTSASRPSSNDAWERPTRQTDTGSGLLDEHGRPRLAGGGRTGGGLPPGTIIEDYANIDRMGTWLKRQTPGYQPGQLDQLWVPHEDILQEWVRRSIKDIWIPIPGTGKAIRCTVVLLMLGGGCGITDPDLMDNEATSRPPPDIPFKPELHEDQESLAAPPTAPER